MDNKTLKQKVRRLTLLFCGYFGCLLLLGVVVILLYFNAIPQQFFSGHNSMADAYYMDYNVENLGDSKAEELIKYGYQLFQNTPRYLGPDNGNPEMAHAGNRLSCNNCHLFAGTKPYSAPLIGIIQRFPQYRGRENKMGTIEERINGCFERSMNGRVLDEDSREMKAYVAYLEFLSRFAPKDGEIKGKGFVKVNIPDRPVDLEHGASVFQSICAVCHGEDGQGQLSEDGYVYEYPPLWGPNSFNNGAGMNRVITAAQFIKGNMPYGATFNFPILTDEQAYDVAGFINQQDRPEKPNLKQDFPDLTKKPVSTPYPPYADPFSVEQHQLGPFQPIMAYYMEKYKMKKTK